MFVNRFTNVGGSMDRSRYSLAGIRSATTEPQEKLIARAVEALRADDRVLAAWLVGSFAVGEADPWSDIDLHFLVPDASAEDLKESWRDLLDRITPTVMSQPFYPGSDGGYSITPDWVHIDLAFHRESALDPKTVEGMAPLLDKRGDLLPDAPTSRTPFVGAPYFPAEVVDFFFYMFGNLVVVVGRDEPAWAMNGVITMRDLGLVPLMFAERGVRRQGGNKRLNPFLSEEQQQVLLRLPPIAPTIDSVIDAEIAIARDFIPRGQALARTLGAAWPEAFEQATIRRVEQAFGVEVL
jgi:hypothetical protein